MPLMLKIQLSVDGLAVVLLLSNAVVPAIQGIALFELALTIGLAEIMWSFGRRISTLLGDRPSDDWDPKIGRGGHVTVVRSWPLAEISPSAIRSR